MSRVRSFESCSAWEEANDLPWERKICLGDHGWETEQNICYINFIQGSFRSTFYWLLQIYFITQKLHISEYVFKNFLEELTLCREIIAVCNISKNSALPQIFLCHTFRTVPKELRYFSKTLSSSPFQQVTLYHSNSCMLYTPNKKFRFSTQCFSNDELRQCKKGSKWMNI